MPILLAISFNHNREGVISRNDKTTLIISWNMWDFTSIIKVV